MTNKTTFDMLTEQKEIIIENKINKLAQEIINLVDAQCVSDAAGVRMTDETRNELHQVIRRYL